MISDKESGRRWKEKCCNHSTSKYTSTVLERYYPEWFPVNEYLAIYQRKPSPSFRTCVKYAFGRNSETWCIWSHFIAFLITLKMHYLFLMTPSEDFVRGWEEKTVISIALACTNACFLLSVIFHTFYCYSMKAYERCLQCDLVGIVVGVKGHYIPWIYYSFYCEESLRNMYFMLVLLSACGGAWSLTRGHLLREEKAPDRAAIAVIILLTCCPGYARILYRDGVIGAWTGGHCWGVAGFLFLAIGVVVYCWKIPECFYPGKYDCMITSHVFFHVLSALASWSFLGMSLHFSRRRFEIGDVCPS